MGAGQTLHLFKRAPWHLSIRVNLCTNQPSHFFLLFLQSWLVKREYIQQVKKSHISVIGFAIS